MDDATLWAAFLNRTLSSAHWNHRSHLRVAWMFLSRYEMDEAHLRMRVAIILLNAVHEVPESPQGGYHETLTRVWLALVGSARGVDAALDSEAFLSKHPVLLERQAPLSFYSRERLLSIAARARFIEPDLAPLP